MERRRLLSVNVNSGVLTIAGTGGADTYVVAKSGTNVTVTENGGAAQSFALASVTSILADLGGGGDSITLTDDILLNAVLNGEAGNDTITSGGGADTLDGGIGDDSLDGGASIDTVSYASRTEAITGNLIVLFDSQQRLQSITGSAGANGETDTYATAETLTGGSGNDSLTASAGPADTDADVADLVTIRLNGGSGNDFLQVSGVIDGNVPKAVPREIADGGDGNDEIYFSYNRSDATTVIGGDGDDLFRNTSDSLATIQPGAGYDTFEFTSVGVTSYTMPLGLEKVSASGGQEATITGNAEANLIDLGAGGTAFGLGGDDTLISGPSAYCTLVGGDGNDRITGAGTGNNLIRPGIGNDSIVGGFGDDTVDYTDHSDSVSASLQVSLARTGSAGNYTYAITSSGTASSSGGEADTFVNVEALAGGSGDDALNLSALDSPFWTEVSANLRPTYGLSGGGGDDALDATGLNSANLTNPITVDLFIDAGDGKDTVVSGAASSEVRGGAGNDSIRINDTSAIEAIGFARNDVDGGDGNDLIVINGGTDTVRGGDGNDSIYAGVGDDRVYGDAGDDRLNGDGGKDTMYGGEGNDRIYGNSGADRLFGELGVDRLYGGNKNDYLDGGAGGDYAKGDEGSDTAKRDRKDRRYEGIEIFV